MPSERIDLTGEQVVSGNLKDKQQIYQIFYYPRERSYTDKIWLYFNQATPEKKYPIKSLCFSSMEQIKTMIKNLTMSYFYLMDKRIIPEIPKEQYRLIMLESLLKEINEMQRKEWSNGNGKIQAKKI